MEKKKVFDQWDRVESFKVKQLEIWSKLSNFICYLIRFIFYLKMNEGIITEYVQCFYGVSLNEAISS